MASKTSPRSVGNGNWKSDAERVAYLFTLYQKLTSM